MHHWCFHWCCRFYSCVWASCGLFCGVEDESGTCLPQRSSQRRIEASVRSSEAECVSLCSSVDWLARVALRSHLGILICGRVCSCVSINVAISEGKRLMSVWGIEGCFPVSG